jgi:8-oxo-dGTP diphosphatase
MDRLLAQADTPSTDTGTGASGPATGAAPLVETPTQTTPSTFTPIIQETSLTQLPETPTEAPIAAPSGGLMTYLPIILGILVVGIGSYVFVKRNKNRPDEKTRKCLNFKRLMEEKLNELTSLKNMLGNFAKEKTIAQIRREVRNKDAQKILDLAEKAEKEYERLKKLYEECVIVPGRTIQKVAWIVIKNRKVMFVRSAKGKGIFYTPGGKVNAGESEKNALVREIKEELNVDLKPETIRHLETFKDAAHNEPPGVSVEIKCYTSDFTGRPVPRGEIEELAALGSKDQAKTTGVGKMVLEWLKSEDLID